MQIIIYYLKYDICVQKFLKKKEHKYFFKFPENKTQISLTPNKQICKVNNSKYYVMSPSTICLI